MNIGYSSKETDNLKNYIIKNKLIDSIEIYFNYELRYSNEEYVYTMVHGWSWDFYIGKGKTVDDAIKNARVFINCYDKGFDKINKEIANMKPIYVEKIIEDCLFNN